MSVIIIIILCHKYQLILIIIMYRLVVDNKTIQNNYNYCVDCQKS